MRRKFKITKKKLKRERREELKKKSMEGGQNERRGKKEDKEVIYFYQFLAYFAGLPSRLLDLSVFEHSCSYWRLAGWLESSIPDVNIVL